MSVIHLSPAERIILINQFEILKYIDPSSKKYHEEKINAIRQGFDTEHEGFTLRCHDGEEEAPEHTFVHDVLTMFRAIEHYKNINPGDTEIVNHSHAKFLGFDGNHESGLLSFTRHLLHNEDSYSEQLPRETETDDFNSHWRASPAYRRMFQVWNDADKPMPPSRETLIAMLTAATER